LTYIDKRNKVRDRRVYWLRKIKTSKGCEKCGYNESPVALDFAHINPREKHLAMVMRSGGNGIINLYTRICIVDKEKNTLYLKELIAEVRKCKIICKNCHVIQTYNNKEFNGAKIRAQRGGSYNMRKSGQKIEENKLGNLTEFLID